MERYLQDSSSEGLLVAPGAFSKRDRIAGDDITEQLQVVNDKRMWLIRRNHVDFLAFYLFN